jgi:hypothetical protein
MIVMEEMMHPAPKEDPFYTAFRGYFSGVLSWEDLDALWEMVGNNAAAGWYVYAIGETPPAVPSTAEQVNTFLSEIDALLRREHQEVYCGIVYTDSKTEPSMIKIFDPSNLGVQCGFSDNPPLPGWVMCLLPPSPLEGREHRPESRKRWWRMLRA